MSKETYLTKALTWVKNKAANAPKANFEGYEKPKAFIKQSSDEEVRPILVLLGNEDRKIIPKLR